MPFEITCPGSDICLIYRMAKKGHSRQIKTHYLSKYFQKISLTTLIYESVINPLKKRETIPAFADTVSRESYK
jgi:hypothetical protein